MRYKKRTLDGRPTFRASALPQGLNPVKQRHGGEHQTHNRMTRRSPQAQERLRGQQQTERDQKGPRTTRPEKGAQDTGTHTPHEHETNTHQNTPETKHTHHGPRPPDHRPRETRPPANTQKEKRGTAQPTDTHAQHTTRQKGTEQTRTNTTTNAHKTPTDPNRPSTDP